MKLLFRLSWSAKDINPQLERDYIFGLDVLRPSIERLGVPIRDWCPIRAVDGTRNKLFTWLCTPLSTLLPPLEVMRDIEYKLPWAISDSVVEFVGEFTPMFCIEELLTSNEDGARRFAMDYINNPNIFAIDDLVEYIQKHR